MWKPKSLNDEWREQFKDNFYSTTEQPKDHFRSWPWNNKNERKWYSDITIVQLWKLLISLPVVRNNSNSITSNARADSTHTGLKVPASMYDYVLQEISTNELLFNKANMYLRDWWWLTNNTALFQFITTNPSAFWPWQKHV